MTPKYIFYLENLKSALDHLEIKASLSYLEIKASLSYLEGDSIRNLIPDEALHVEPHLKTALLGYNRFTENISILERLHVLSELLDIPVADFDHSFKDIEQPLCIEDEKVFREKFTRIRKVFLQNRVAYKRKLSTLSPSQKKTLDEALHCYFEKCYHSSIVMAISSIESKISDYITSMNRGLDVERQMLSQVIEDYLNNREYYHRVFEDHEELLRLCDRYRLLSPHPQEGGVNKNKAAAIIHLVFEFLFDCALKKKIQTFTEAEETQPIYFIKRATS